ncbi:Kazal domain-containing protein [Purpureocillium lavendulum]|uniref:Kazal domain-containing protein n=1 Tax=Purpureocillium lavendulum TaxID=1247861 RepID=A0AB34FSH8_9HYPO|nr:Kazal domain-containing protein [Purpureocillium lavendulum]
MLLRHIAALAAFASGLALARDGRPCGFKIAPCPDDAYCRPNSPSCTDVNRCAGTCVPVRNKYPSCGGKRATPRPCPPGTRCVDDPRDPLVGCGLACDKPGICVPDKPAQCSGFMGLMCPDGLHCYDKPKDGCDPKKGGADCIGICL